jgi:non-ribosomal peptide synthetase component F
LFSLKAQIRHNNFTECTHSFVHIDTFIRNDTVIQMSRCSFDTPVQEILDTLIRSATLAMLHPRGTIDSEYVSEVFKKKQIMYMHVLLSLLHSFFSSALDNKRIGTLKYLRSLCSSGE